ncbi:MAG: hypothetical protein KDA72_01605 [Planctomycetales bacterium]|nr:hypothetical protein [Planctomycetales bacterium]
MRDECRSQIGSQIVGTPDKRHAHAERILVGSGKSGFDAGAIVAATLLPYEPHQVLNIIPVGVAADGKGT